MGPPRHRGQFDETVDLYTMLLAHSSFWTPERLILEPPGVHFGALRVPIFEAPGQQEIERQKGRKCKQCKALLQFTSVRDLTDSMGGVPSFGFHGFRSARPFVILRIPRLASPRSGFTGSAPTVRS